MFGKLGLACLSVLLAGMSAGCVTQQQAPSDTNERPLGAMISDSINRAFKPRSEVTGSTGAGTSRSAAPVGKSRFQDLKLAGVLENSRTPGWPRVAVNINRLPAWFYGMPPSGMPGTYGPADCINITVTVWQSTSSSHTHEGVDFCGTDIVRNTPFSDVGLTWKNFGIVTGKNTGAQRTAGPLPPSRLFPNQPGLDMFFHMNGSYYLGSIMATVGYNWKEPQDARFWVVKVPTQGSVR